MICNLHFNEYTTSPISLKRYSNSSQNSLKSWAEFGGSSFNAQGDAFRNFCLVRIIIRSLNSRSVSFSSQPNNMHLENRSDEFTFDGD